MNEIPDTIDTLHENMIHAARHYLSLGYKPIPLLAGTKQAAIKWKQFQTQAPSEREVDEFFSTGEPGIALVTGSGLVVVDIDDPALLDAVIEHCGYTPMKCRTPSSGVHCYYRMRAGVHYGNAVKIRNRPIDLRCEGAYAVAPWSRNAEGKAYEWLGAVLPVDELPLLKVSWLRERSPVRSRKPIEESIGDGIMVRRALAWAACVEGAVSGQRGHAATFRFCCRLTHLPPRGFGLSFAQAWPILLEWNEQCEPPWSEAELTHKLSDSIKERK